MSEVIRLFDDRPHEKVLVLSGTADASAAACLSVLANLAPAAVPRAALPSTFSKTSSH
jgi:hypothetical protein